MALPENSEPVVYQVMAIDRSGGLPHRRFFGGRDEAQRLAERIARSSETDERHIDRGAVSVWVEGDEGVIWAAGQKAAEMKAEGIEIDYWGEVRAA